MSAALLPSPQDDEGGSHPEADATGDPVRVPRTCSTPFRPVVLSSPGPSPSARGWTLWVPFIPPGSNAIQRMHWRSVHHWRVKIHREMDPLLRMVEGSPGFSGPFRRATLCMGFCWSDRRRRDPLNYVEGAKAIVDSMIGRLIVDDDVDHLPTTIVRGVLGAEATGVLVQVWEDE